MTEQTREAWLLAAVGAMRPWFDAEGAELPEVRVSFGFPRGSHGRSRAIGQCWQGQAVKDGRVAIFVSPELDEPARILDVLLHELVHAATPGAGHRKPFSQLAKKLGLEKPWTATTASEDLKTSLDRLATGLGPLDHSSVNGSKTKKQTTRMLKVACAYCGYTVRTTQKWLDVGNPSCPEGDEMGLEV